MKSVSIVSTATQLINCIEAIRYYKTSENVLVIITADKNRLKPILHLLNRVIKEGINFDKILNFRYFEINKYVRIILMKLFIRKIFKNLFSDIVILSNYKHATQRYALNYLYKNNNSIKTILVDDGLSVPELMKRRNEEVSTKNAYIYYAARFYKYVYAGIKKETYIPETIDFFTIHNQIELSTHDNRIINNYNFIKNTNIGKIATPSSDKILVIIGQPLVQIRLVNKQRYIEYIKQFMNEQSISKSSVYYYPHPAENLQDTFYLELSKIVEIQETDLPFELTAIQLPQNAVLVGFFTSALVNIKKLVPMSELYAIYVNEIDELIDQNRKRILLNVYQYLETEGIQLKKYK